MQHAIQWAAEFQGHSIPTYTGILSVALLERVVHEVEPPSRHDEVMKQAALYSALTYWFHNYVEQSWYLYWMYYMQQTRGTIAYYE